MKKIFFLFLILVSIFFLTSSKLCYAHSGDTDANGGHTNSSTGEYHYHHGYPAHQHPGGKCPYDFNDATGNRDWNNNGSGSSNGSYNTYKDNGFLFPVIIIGIIVIIYIGYKVKEKIEDVQYQKRKQEEYEKEKQLMTQKYGGKNISEIIQIPIDSEIGEDNLPREINSSYLWGEKYTFYCTSSGKYHLKTCKYAHCGRPTNAHKLNAKNVPCSLCNPKKPDTTWVEEYNRIIRIKEKFKIE